MERVISPEERIRKAEDIYYRRKMQKGVRVSASGGNSSVRDKYNLYKKLILQILICFFIYFIFYLVKYSNYIFSESVISKSKMFLSYDINFQKLYEEASDYYDKNIKNYLFSTSKLNAFDGVKESGDNNLIINEVVKETSAEAVVKLSQMEIDANEIKSKHSLVLPLVGTISSRYGPRKGSNIVSSNHAGIDIAANEGTVFYAAMSGDVISVSSEGSYGNHIFIKEDNVTTVYAHCKKIYVKEGDKIKQGQELGEVGQTGNATGPHLHFEIRIDDRTVNPEMIIDFG